MSYYAVIFTTTRTEGDDGYSEMAVKMEELAKQQDGFIGFESARDENLGITVSYWSSLDSIKKWKEHSEHVVARDLGREKWYKSYHLRIAKIENEYTFQK